MTIRIIGLAIAAAALATACTPAPGSAEWCKGVVEGSIQPTPEQMLGNMEKCAAHELAG